MDKPTLELLLIGGDGVDGTAAYLAAQGHKVTYRHDGESGLSDALVREFEVIVVDSLTPRIEGITVLKMLREVGRITPVLYLTHQQAIEGRVEPLKAGADDCLARPFDNRELAARIRALSRRGCLGSPSTVLRASGIELNLITRAVVRERQNISLQPQEFRLLECLVRNAGHAVSRARLLEEVWGLRFDPNTNVVQTHICHLRQKVDRGFERVLIRTVRGSGYMISTG